MVGNPLILNGLKLADYIHPAEEKIRHSHLESCSLVKKGLDVLNDASVQLLRQITEGKWVEVTRQTAPQMFKIVEDVCRVLDYTCVPRLFIRHERSMRVIVGGTGYMQMLIPDYLVNEFDLGMQYYMVGNAISMFKSDHVQLATICSVICENAALEPVRLALQAYLRAADLTSDRGGLLACQDFSAASRCLLVEAGLPLTEMRNLSAEDTMHLVRRCIEETNIQSTDMSVEAAAFWKRVNRADTPAVERLQELLAWHDDGYSELLRHWDGGERLQ